MGFGSLRQTWKDSRAWGKSVPEVPEDHVDMPRKGSMRFDGNHGAWMAPLGMVALLLCTLATLSTPVYEPMSLVDVTIAADLPGGPGATQKLKVGLWGLCLAGSDGDCSKLRGLFSSFGKVTSDLPEHLKPLADALTSIPQPFLNAAGVFPIFANAYIYFGAIYAAWSSTFFERKERRTVQWQEAAIACYHWVLIWISIAFGLQIGLYYKVKENIEKTDIKDHVQTAIGASVWVWLASLLVMLWASVTWMTWRFHSKRGTWKPAAWMQYIGDPQAATETSQGAGQAVDAENKEEEAQREKCSSINSFDQSSNSHDHDLPTYTLTAPTQETDLSSMNVENGAFPPQRHEGATGAASVQKAEESSAVAAAPASHAF